VRAVVAELTWSDDAFRRDLAVLVEGDRITKVTTVADVPPDTSLEKWPGLALVPGTVNAHGHAFQNLFKGFADDRSFESWRDDVLYPFSESLDQHAIYVGALFAFAEALLAGVTTTVDFFYLNDGGNDNAATVIRAAKDIGIRLVLARGFYDPAAPTRAPERYREPARAAAERCAELHDAYAGEALVNVQPAPHSLHAASPETVRVALDLAGSLGTPCHLHLAEARYESQLVQERYGTTPVRLLAREGLLSDRLVTVHAVWADDEELDLIAEAGAGVVHCPGANAFLGDGIARLPEMLKRGIRVALGPDGGCANNRQSVFDEMRQATLMAKARQLDGAAVDAPTAFRLGTSAGGDLLGIPVGSVARGSFADFVGLDLDDLSLQPTATLDRQIVASMQPTAIKKVMVGGRLVVDDANLVQVKADRVRDLVETVTAGWERP
jgi:5-methylthioadenosine/S-adenosylhomocysteine deaminase